MGLTYGELLDRLVEFALAGSRKAAMFGLNC